MFVIRVTRSDGTDRFRHCGDADTAKKQWAKIIDRAVAATEAGEAAVKARMYELAETDKAKAKTAVLSGKIKEFKSVAIRPGRSLKGKVRVGGPRAVDGAALDRAQSTIDAKAGDYLTWVRVDIDALVRVVSELRRGEADVEDALDELNRVSYRIKGQGGTFGYSLMTVIADHLCNIVDALDEVKPKDLDAIQVHVDSMRTVLAHRLSGTGGEVGKQLIEGLLQLSNKILEGKSASGTGD